MPELVKDLPFSDYCAIDALNSSTLAWGDKSMFHLHEAIAGRLERDDTDSMRFGRAVHCSILEPHRFASEFLVATGCQSQFKDGAACTAPGKFHDGKSWFCGRHKHDDCTQPTDYITPDEAERLLAMANRLHEHEFIKVLRRKGWSEVVIQWEYAGRPFKCRIDRLPEEMDIVLDIKKCQLGKARDEDCQSAIANYGYHRQAALYCDAVRAVHPLGSMPRFAWVFIEEKYPHGVNVIVADDETLEIGRQEVDDVLARYQRCEQLGVFPDYMPDQRRPLVGGLPPWYRQKWARIRESIGANE